MTSAFLGRFLRNASNKQRAGQSFDEGNPISLKSNELTFVLAGANKRKQTKSNITDLEKIA